MRIRVIASVFAVLLLGACATVPPSQVDEKVVELIDAVNTRPVDELPGYTGMPFLFGDQVLYAQADVSAVLERARDAGLVIAPVIVGSASAPEKPADARFDVGLFYDRLPPDARLILVDSKAGELSLIVGDESNGLPRLLGLVRGRL